LDRLFTANQSYWIRSVRASEADAIYMQAWSLGHFLIFAEQGKYETAFLNFLVQLNRRVEWRQAFVASFGMPDFNVLQTKWLEYARTTPPSDYRETVRRLAFLAAGMTELHKQGRRPTSLEELRRELQEIRFECRPELFGQERKLSAADPRMFEVPYAEGIEQRKFTLAEPRGAAGNNPPPCTITAGGLAPQLFTAQWKRQGRESAYVLAVSPTVQQNAKPGRKK